MKFLNVIASDSSRRAFCVNWQRSSFRYKYLNETRVQIHAAHTKQMPHVVTASLSLSLSLSLFLVLLPTTMTNGGGEHECIMHVYIVIHPMDRLVLSFCYEFSEQFNHAKTESVRILFELKNIVIRRSTFVNKTRPDSLASLYVGRDKWDFY